MKEHLTEMGFDVVTTLGDWVLAYDERHDMYRLYWKDTDLNCFDWIYAPKAFFESVDEAIAAIDDPKSIKLIARLKDNLEFHERYFRERQSDYFGLVDLETIQKAYRDIIHQLRKAD